MDVSDWVSGLFQRAACVLFTGQYEHTIDAKNRLAVPADIRARWRPEEQGLGWYAVPATGGVIRLYPERDFEARARTGFLSLTPDEDEVELQATLFGLSERLELDAAGRIRLPDTLLEVTKPPPEVVLIGCGDRLEIRDRAEWKAGRAARVAKMSDLVSRISAKKQPPA